MSEMSVFTNSSRTGGLPYADSSTGECQAAGKANSANVKKEERTGVEVQHTMGFTMEANLRQPPSGGTSLGPNISYAAIIKGGGMPEWFGAGPSARFAPYGIITSTLSDDDGVRKVVDGISTKNPVTGLWGFHAIVGAELVFTIEGVSYQDYFKDGVLQFRLCPAELEIDYSEVTRADGSEKKGVSPHYAGRLGIDYYFSNSLEHNKPSFGTSFNVALNDELKITLLLGLGMAF